MVCGAGCHSRGEDHHRGAKIGTRELLQREGSRGRRFWYKIDFGPGYRVYFGKDGDTLVILLVGGTKKTQARDIGTAHARWQDYKKRKAEEK